MVKHEISIISPIGLVHWLLMPGHFSKILLIPHQKSAVCLNCQIKFIKSNTPSYNLHFGSYNTGVIGVSFTIFMQNAM